VEVANLAIAAALCGLIWTIQLVHYPLFALVGEAQWVAYGEAHRQRITWLVLPLMTANVAVAALLALREPDALRLVNAALPAAIFLSTGLVYARLHGELAPRFAHDRLRLLVRLNWLRTAAWTVQVGVAVALAG
jgi:hypothetical protein